MVYASKENLLKENSNNNNNTFCVPYKRRDIRFPVNYQENKTSWI